MRREDAADRCTFMSVTIDFRAIIPVDGDTYRKQLAVATACSAAGVPLPQATADFFGADDEDRGVDSGGISICIDKYSKYRAVTGDIMCGDGAVIDLTKLPPGTTKIRVFCCE